MRFSANDLLEPTTPPPLPSPSLPSSVPGFSSNRTKWPTNHFSASANGSSCPTVKNAFDTPTLNSNRPSHRGSPNINRKSSSRNLSKSTWTPSLGPNTPNSTPELKLPSTPPSITSSNQNTTTPPTHSYFMFPEGRNSNIPAWLAEPTNEINPMDVDSGVPEDSPRRKLRPFRFMVPGSEPIKTKRWTPPIETEFIDYANPCTFHDRFPLRDDLDPVEKQRILARREQERINYHKATVEFVRIGGMLPTRDGGRDVERTERIRQEIREEAERKEEERKRAEEEKAMWDQIKRYDERWGFLMKQGIDEFSNGREITFEDIPWPIFGAPRSEVDGVMKSNVTSVTIAMFLFAPQALHESSNPQTVADAPLAQKPKVKTSKETIRETILRFHPDKFETRIPLHRVREADREMVRETGRVVMEYLMKQLDLEQSKEGR